MPPRERKVDPETAARIDRYVDGLIAKRAPLTEEQKTLIATILSGRPVDRRGGDDHAPAA